MTLNSLSRDPDSGSSSRLTMLKRAVLILIGMVFVLYAVDIILYGVGRLEYGFVSLGYIALGVFVLYGGFRTAGCPSIFTLIFDR
jgi:uncharacterized membrane protein